MHLSKDSSDKKMKQVSEKPLLRVLRQERLYPPPLWLMRQAGRYLPEYRKLREEVGDFLSLCLTPRLAAEATLQPVRRFGFDAAILFADILLVPHALGQEVRYEDGGGPRLSPLEDEHALARLKLDGVRERLSAVYETIERVRGLLPDGAALIGFAGAPWTVATYMLTGAGPQDRQALALWEQSRAQIVDRLVALLTEATLSYLEGQIKAGAEVVQLFDSWAGVLSSEGFLRWCVEPTKRIVTSLKGRFPNVPVIGFPRGVRLELPRYAAETQVSCVSLDWTVSLEWARDALQPHMPLQGNLAPQTLVAGGDKMRTEAQRILECWGKGPMIFNLGHGVLPETPPEHVAELVRFVRGARP